MTHQPTAGRRFRPIILIAAGLLLLVAGFIYDFEFAGIPYQDPTPELSARYARHASIASAIRWSGAGIFMLGWLASLVQRLTRKTPPSAAV
jgi:hypothetical protein